MTIHLPRPTLPAASRAVVFALTLGALAALGLAGCGDDDPTGPGGGAYVDATTPINAVRRLLATYAAQDRGSYATNFTGEYAFIFSPDSDSALAEEFGTIWNAAEEDAAAHHLFDGFISEHGPDTLAGAMTITWEFPAASVLDDPEHADSTSHYALVRVPILHMEISLDDDDELAFELPYDFYVVRGDVAIVEGGQAADSTLWYVRKIDDQSPAPVHATRPSTLHETGGTWGGIRGLYRH